MDKIFERELEICKCLTKAGKSGKCIEHNTDSLLGFTSIVESGIFK